MYRHVTDEETDAERGLSSAQSVPRPPCAGTVPRPANPSSPYLILIGFITLELLILFSFSWV